VTVAPRDEHRLFSQPGELPELALRRRYHALDRSAASIARAEAAQVLERIDAVVAVGPLHADRVTSNFVEPLDLRILWLDKCHGRTQTISPASRGGRPWAIDACRGHPFNTIGGSNMDEKAKKQALLMIPYGLFVLGAAHGGKQTAATVNWVTQASFNPPLV